ncbi:hypothetical protein ZIOFF_004780 [Zingiber officinale]|uniref:HTH myb-type domain-containing protein n=2 Tax=Zingiber officinale TaxID=94328 RepID=A0A8J5LM48_ZINOF|nr:hypothetical protein ZIOFF_004780 [Zingiber officinale]
MGEEAAGDDEFDRLSASDGREIVEDRGRVMYWEVGLPSGDDLTPLSQMLVPPHLASAFSVKPEPPRTDMDVQRASQYTISNLRRTAPSPASTAALRNFSPFSPDESLGFEANDLVENGDSCGHISRSGQISPSAALEEAESSAPVAEDSGDEPSSSRNPKRARLVWTPQLHKRFIDVVAHLGIKNAVPKTIMQLMNVDGLTRENVASHLQKYRLYLRRMNGIQDDSPSLPDHLLTTMQPAKKSLHEQHAPYTPLQYPMPTMIPVPTFGMAPPHGHGVRIGMVPTMEHQGDGRYAFEQHYNGALGERMKDW